VKGGEITLRVPVQVGARQVRQWLGETFPDVDPGRQGEQERIQEQVDRTFITLTSASWEEGDVGSVYADDGPSPAEYLLWKEETEEAGVRMRHLVSAVSDEKADHIDDLRPSIRRLGADKLRRLIARVFRDLMHPEHRDAAIARDFGLSRATFSRFAGSRWHEGLDSGEPLRIPDLWQNLAHVMARDPVFLAAATRAGVLGSLSRSLDAMGESLVEGEDDG
jgi:hypothetical protein